METGCGWCMRALYGCDDGGWSLIVWIVVWTKACVMRICCLCSLDYGCGRIRASTGAFLPFILIIELVSGARRHKPCKRMRKVIQGENVPCMPQRTNRSCLLRGSGKSPTSLVGWHCSAKRESRIMKQQQRNGGRSPDQTRNEKQIRRHRRRSKRIIKVST